MQKTKRRPNMPVSFWQRFWMGYPYVIEMSLSLEASRQKIETQTKRFGNAKTRQIDANAIAFTVYVQGHRDRSSSAWIKGTLTRVDGHNTLVASRARIPLSVRIVFLAFASLLILLGVRALNFEALGMAAIMLGLLLLVGLFFRGYDHDARRLSEYFRAIFEEDGPDTEIALYDHARYKIAGEILLETATADMSTGRQSMRLSPTITFEVPQSIGECRARIYRDFNTRRGTLRAQIDETAADQVVFKIDYLGDGSALIKSPLARVTGTLTETGQGTRVEMVGVQYVWENVLPLIVFTVLFEAVVWTLIFYFRPQGNGLIVYVLAGCGMLLMTLFFIGMSHMGFLDTAKGLAGALHATLNVPLDMDEMAAASGDEAFAAPHVAGAASGEHNYPTEI